MKKGGAEGWVYELGGRGHRHHSNGKAGGSGCAWVSPVTGSRRKWRCDASPRGNPGQSERRSERCDRGGGINSLAAPLSPFNLRGVKERTRPTASCEAGSPGPSLQHSFLTDVSHVCEMEGGLLSLLNDFHSGKLQAFGQVCSFEQLERVREMQEQLARLHFSLDVCAEDLREETHAEQNLEQLLSNLEELSNSIQKLHLAENQEATSTPSDEVTESLQ
eukprot:XP_017946726.1 PREDICTED: coiled-coil domain-containing protein 28B isoform X1 [Xenopus tropicalis]